MSTLNNLKKAAKRWLKALRANDDEARERLRRAYPDAPAEPGLRDIQHALAREHGHESWNALRQAQGDAPEDAPEELDLPATGGHTHAERVATFLEFACWDHHVHGKGDHRMHDRAAQRLLAQHPEIARDSLYTAVVCGELQEVERILAERPEAACEPGGARGWTPILYLCYTRFSHQSTIDNAVSIAGALLDRGANTNDFYMAGDASYTVLVGVAGEGEQDSPRQPQGKNLFQLLLERGAEPFDIQVLYNTHFSGDVLWWLELIYAHTVKTGRKTAWDDPNWPMLDMGGYGQGAHFLLGVAVKKNDIQLAEWLLTRGADPNANKSSHPKFKATTTHYQEALRNGFTEMAELLVRYGAMPSAPVLDDYETFEAACFRLGRVEVQAHLKIHPEYLQSHRVMFAAARRDRPDVVELLLDLGMPLEVEDQHKQRPLHEAAGHGALRVAALLIERGAEIDPRETNWNSTPIGFAAYGDRVEMVEFLSRFSRNVWTLAFRGYVDRLREVLQSEPELAKVVTKDGITPLWWLPDDEAKALEIVELFLSHGADAFLRSNEGKTAADWALKRGMLEVAQRLAAAAGREPPPRHVTIPAAPASPTLDQYESLAKDLVIAYDSGYPTAMERLSKFYERSVTWEELRAGVQQRLSTMPTSEKPPGNMYEGYFALPHARFLIARQAGFPNWTALAKTLEKSTSLPQQPYTIDWKNSTIRPRRTLVDSDWDTLFGEMKELGITGLDAGEQMTDAVMKRLSELNQVTRLSLSGSKRLSDDGLLHLTRMPQLQELDLSGWHSPITDRGLEVLRHLPDLRRFQMCWPQRVSDAGVANLTFCDHLESVDLLGTPTGDGAIIALSGKRKLRRFKTGKQVTDAGLALLHGFPVFKTWHGGDISYSLMSPDAEPTHLLVDGPFTDKGLAGLVGLDGLFALSFFWHSLAFTADGLEPLAQLPNLGFLGCEGERCNEAAMHHISAMPRLRMLMAQGTVAGDDGFAALSRSQTIEYIWGRECPNLTGRGFAALAAMPALRGLAVSCKNVDDTALSALPRFPALRELMPMDVSNDGFRHVGRCEQLEALWCMYCRETGDTATGPIAGLNMLKSYYAGSTQITDRSLEILGQMPSLERLEFRECAGITDAGIAFLAGLPRLREVSIGGSPRVTHEGVAVFPAYVRVDYS